MEIIVDGRGTFTLSLSAGNMDVTFEGNIVLRTKGNPTKRGNPPFNSIEECAAYFDTLPISQPIITEGE